MVNLLQFPEIDTQKFHIFIADSDTIALHGHSFLEFTYVSKGTMDHIVDGSRSVVTEGDYFIVDYGTVHSYQRISETPLRVINLLFCPDFLNQILSGRRYFEDAANSYLLRFNYHYPTPLSRLAQQQGYSAAYLSRKFSQEMGMGYFEYVPRVRIGQSCHLLENTQLPISEIAAAVGYEDPKFFHQVFRKILHTSPREYRRTMINK